MFDDLTVTATNKNLYKNDSANMWKCISWKQLYFHLTTTATMNLFLQDVECKYESLLTYTANMAYDFLQCMYESVAKNPHLPGGEYTLCLYWLSIYRYTIYIVTYNGKDLFILTHESHSWPLCTSLLPERILAGDDSRQGGRWPTWNSTWQRRSN